MFCWIQRQKKHPNNHFTFLTLFRAHISTLHHLNFFSFFVWILYKEKEKKNRCTFFSIQIDIKQSSMLSKTDTDANTISAQTNYVEHTTRVRMLFSLCALFVLGGKKWNSEKNCTWMKYFLNHPITFNEPNREKKISLWIVAGVHTSHMLFYAPLTI